MPSIIKDIQSRLARSLFTAGVAALVFFALLSKFEDRPFIRSADFAFTVKLQERIDKSAHLRLADAWGNAMEGGVFAGSPLVTGMLTLSLAAVYAVRSRRRRWIAVAIPVFFILVLGGEVLGKSIVHHPSPPFFMIKHPATIFPANYVNEQFSYPSGHAARSVFVALVAAIPLAVGVIRGSKRARVAVLVPVLYAVWVSVSVIYLGHHWMSDVTAGLFLGISMASLSLVPILKNGMLGRLEHVREKDSHDTGVDSRRKVMPRG